MAIKATAKWKTLFLHIPRLGMRQRPAGVGRFADSVETWLVTNGYAVFVEAEVYEEEIPSPDEDSETLVGVNSESDQETQEDASSESDQEANQDDEPTQPFDLPSSSSKTRKKRSGSG